MNCIEYENIKHFTYDKYCDYLQNKHGIGKYDYMTKSWNKNTKCTRTKEGLTVCNIFIRFVARQTYCGNCREIS